jgi:hypothetical protein
VGDLGGDKKIPAACDRFPLPRVLGPQLAASEPDFAAITFSALGCQPTGRAQPNLTRTLAKLEAVGFIRMKVVGRRKAPSAAIKKIVVEIDPFSDNARLRVA